MLGAGDPPAGNLCEKAIVLPGVRGLPEDWRSAAPLRHERSPHEMPMPLTAIASEFG
jgi:hypothetical protein